MSGQPRILGVYSKTAQAGTGMGATAKKAVHKTYWFVRMMPDDTYETRALNANHVPAGPAFQVTKKDFMALYRPETDYYLKKTVPCLESLNKKIEKGEALFNGGDLDAAEKEFCKALNLDEENPKANVGLGKVYTGKCDYVKLKTVMKRIMCNDRMFNEEQRHLFNDFGINLRKGKLFSEAIGYYDRALEFHPGDEHLHFNIARAYFECNDLDNCRDHLKKALEIKPEFREAKLFLNHCDIVGVDTGGLSRDAAE